MATRDEILRFLVETKGDESLRILVKEILDIGEAGSESEKDLKRLLDQIGDANKLEKAAAGYRKIGQSVLEAGREYQTAQAAVVAFARSMDAEPTKKQAAELERLRAVVKGTSADYEAQKGRLAAVRAEVVGLGGSVTQLSAAERTAATVRKDAITGVDSLARSLREQAQAAKQAAADRVEAERQAQAAVAEADKAYRLAVQQQAIAAAKLAADHREASAERQRQLKADAAELKRTADIAEQAALKEARAANARAQAVREGGIALDKYNEKQRKTAAEADQVSSSATRMGGVFARLQGILATLATYLGFRAAVEGIKNILGLSAATENLQRSFGQLFGGVDAGNQAFAQIKQLAKDTGQDFGATAEAAKTLKAFGIDPLGGSLRALIDENVALGGSQERLKGIVLALGQVYTKQKLQGEEVLQLAERGIPVWDLLAKATGKNVLELQKLSEQGKLGRKELALLIEEIGKTYKGAAAQGLTTLSGLFQQVRDSADNFLRLIGESGVVDYFKTQLAALNAEVNRLAANGKLKEYAVGIASAITGVASAVKSAVVFLFEYSRQIIGIGVAIAGIKFAGLLAGLAESALRWVQFGKAAATAGDQMAQTTGRFGALRSALAAVPTRIAITVAVLAADQAQQIIRNLAADLVELSRVGEAKAATDERIRRVNEQLAEQYRRTADGLKQYADVTKLTAGEVLVLADAERQAYLKKLEGQAAYLDALVKEGVRRRELGQITQEELSAQINALREAQAALAAFQDLLNGLSADGLSAAVRQVIQDLKGAEESAASAETKFDAFFKTLNFQRLEPGKLGDFARAIAQMGTEAVQSGRNLQSGLISSLQKLSGSELLKFQTESAKAFAFYETGPKAAQLVLESTLTAALQKLGVEASQLGFKFTAAGEQTIASFQAVAQNALATGNQIEAAFTAAIRAAATSGELEALGTALRSAFDQGRLGVTDFEQSTLALNQRMRELRAEVDPLRQSFEALGLTSQQSLADARDTAREAFEAIESGARRGEASLGDVRAAFEAYARKALDAAASSKEWERDQVEAALRIKGEVIGATAELERLGLVGKQAGKEAADGLNDAGDALDGLSDKAARAGDSLDGVGSAASGTASALADAAAQATNAANSSDRLGFALGNVSQEFAEANRQIAEGFGGRDLFVDQQRRLTEELERQRAAAGERIQQLDEELARYDPLTKYLERARREYGYLDDAALRGVAERLQRLDQARERAAEDAKREEQQAATSSARREREFNDELKRQDELDRRNAERNRNDAGPAPRPEAPAPSNSVVRIELVVKNEQGAGGQTLNLSNEQLRQITDGVLREIELARRN